MDLSKEEKIRTFIAIDLPEEIKAQIRGVVEELKEIGARVVWTRLENLHLTLKFLGNTSVGQLDKIKSLLEEVGQESGPITLSFKGLGGFPNEKKPRIVWMGVDHGSEELKQLFYLAEQSLISLDFKQEKNPFLPHLTLGRIKLPQTNKQLEKKLSEDKEREFGSVAVSDFKLLESTLTSEGPVYKVLHQISLN